MAEGEPNARQGLLDRRITTTGQLGYRPELDGLRGVAVLAVVAYHYLDGVRLVRGGFLGVDLFFVMSGFLITRLLLEERGRSGRIDLRAFYARRAGRLLPALLIVCLVVVIDALTIQGLGPTRASLVGVAATLGYVANWIRVFGINDSPLGHAWSLSIEEQFYLLWPVVILAVLRSAGQRRIALLSWALFVIAAVQMAIRSFAGVDSYVLYNSTDAHGLVVLMGGCLLALYLPLDDSLSTRPIGVAARWALVPTLAVLTFFLVGPTSRSDFYPRIGFVIATACFVVIICCALQPGRLRQLLSNSALVMIGKLSYGIYLWHLLPFDYLVGRSAAGIPNHEIRLISLVVTGVVATASFVLVEQPVRRTVAGRLREGRWRS